MKSFCYDSDLAQSTRSADPCSVFRSRPFPPFTPKDSDDFFRFRDIFVDDDFDENTPGWGVTHFNTIEDGLDAVGVGGIVHVYPGVYVPWVRELVVPESITLKLYPGAVIGFKKAGSPTGMTVNGSLVAQGTRENPVIFTSSACNPAPGDWNRLSFGTTSKNSIIDNCIIEYATVGVNVVWDTITEPRHSPVEIMNSMFREIGLRGVQFSGWTAPIGFPRDYRPITDVSITGCSFINVGKGTQGNPMAIYTRAVKDVDISDNLFQGGQGTCLAYLGVAFENYLFKGNVIEDPGYNQGIYVSTTRGTVEITRNIFRGQATAANFRCIYVFGHENLVIAGNEFRTGSSGVYLLWFPYGTLGTIIEENLFDGVGTGTSDSFAIVDSLIGNYFGKVVIRNNVIRNTNGVGIWATPGHKGSCVIEGNFLENNRVGIRVGTPAYNISSVSVHYNSIAGNKVGLERIGLVAIPLDATDNWWGNASGPSGMGPGSGDTVSTDVVFDPWLASLNLSPGISDNPVNKEHAVTATLRDNRGQTVITDLPSVRFEVTGPGNRTEIVHVEDGMATLRYSSTMKGTDNISATALFAQKESNLQSTSTFKIWR